MYEAEGRLWNKIAGFEEGVEVDLSVNEEKKIPTKIQT